MRVTRIAGFEGVRAGVHPQYQVDDVPQRNVGDMRSGPAAPAQVVTDALRWDLVQRVIERLDP
jgi:hypothetical protein